MATHEDGIESDLTDLTDCDDDELEEEEPLRPITVPVQARQPSPQPQPQLAPPITATRRSTRTRNYASTALQPQTRRALPTSRTISYSTDMCLGWMKTDIIDLEAEYQRDVVWPEQKMSMLIDSLMNNFYVPPIIFCVRTDPNTRRVLRRVCIDGKQRLTSIRRFMEGDLCHKDAVTGKKSWYNTKGIRGRKEMTARQKLEFAAQAVVCVEYDDLDEKEERELFSRVQNGIALTPAERMQAFNGPYPDLVRELAKKTKCFGDRLNWGKLRGRDFQSIAQILYLVEYHSPSSKAKTRVPPEPSTAKVESWLNSNSKEDAVPSKVAHRARTVFLLVNILVLDIDGKGWDEPFKFGSHKYSPIEFVMTAYMIVLYGETLTISQLSAGVKHLRNHARRDKEELRYNSSTYKDLVKYVRNHVKDAVLNDSIDVRGEVPAFQWAQDNAIRLQKAIEDYNDATKAEGTSTAPTSSSKRKGKVKVDKDANSEIGANDSDAPLQKKIPKRTPDGAEDAKPPKARKTTSNAVASTSAPSRSLTPTVKIEKSASATTSRKRPKPDDEDPVDEKTTRKRRTTSINEPGVSAPLQFRAPARSKKTQTPAVATAKRPPTSDAASAPISASAPAASSISTSPSNLPTKRISKVSSIFIPKQPSQSSQKTGKASSSATPRSPPVTDHSVLPPGAPLSRRDGGTFPSSASANPSNGPNSSPQLPAQDPVQQTSTADTPGTPAITGWTPALYPSSSNPPPERLGSFREARQRAQLSHTSSHPGTPSAPSNAPAIFTPTRDPRRRPPAVAPPAVLSPTLVSTQSESMQGLFGHVPHMNQLEQRLGHPGLPSALQTPPHSPIPMSDIPLSSPVTPAAWPGPAIAPTSCRDDSVPVASNALSPVPVDDASLPLPSLSVAKVDSVAAAMDLHEEGSIPSTPSALLPVALGASLPSPSSSVAPLEPVATAMDSHEEGSISSTPSALLLVPSDTPAAELEPLFTPIDLHEEGSIPSTPRALPSVLLPPDAGLPPRPPTPSGPRRWDTTTSERGPAHSRAYPHHPPTSPRRDRIRDHSSKPRGRSRRLSNRPRFDLSPQRYDYSPQRRYDHYSPRTRQYERHSPTRWHYDDNDYCSSPRQYGGCYPPYNIHGDVSSSLRGETVEPYQSGSVRRREDGSRLGSDPFGNTCSSCNEYDAPYLPPGP